MKRISKDFKFGLTEQWPKFQTSMYRILIELFSSSRGNFFNFDILTSKINSIVGCKYIHILSCHLFESTKVL